MEKLKRTVPTLYFKMFTFVVYFVVIKYVLDKKYQQTQDDFFQITFLSYIVSFIPKKRNCQILQ